MTTLLRRQFLFLLPSTLVPACGPPPPPQGITVTGEAPKLRSDARIHAYGAAGSSYSFMWAHALYWPRLLEPLSTDGIVLLEALRAKGYVVEAYVVEEPPKDDDDVGGVKAEFAFPKKGEPRKEFSGLPDPVGDLEGIDPLVLWKGRMALYSVAAMLGLLNVSNDLLQRNAFALLVLKKKIENGEKADWAGDRPAQESLADIDLALRIIADNYEQIQVWRIRVITMFALVHAFDQPGGIDALRAEIAQAKKQSADWIATHHQPTLEDFGVGMQDMPMPEPLVKKLDIDLGIIGAVLQTAQGIATGSPQATLEGLSKLAPKDSTVGVALAGLAAASKGDVSGVVDAVAKLSGKEEEVKAIKQRLAPFQMLAKKTGAL